MSRDLINAGIVGIGTYVPDRVLANTDLEKMVDTTDDWIVERTGIRERRIAEPEQATSDLAVIAGERALADAGVDPLEVDLIIVCTNTADMTFPATACLVQERLGARKAAAFDLLAGCTGFVYGIGLSSQFIATGAYRTILVIGAETLSRVVNYRDRNMCVLFGDGAGAAVLRPVANGSGILAFRLWADGAGAPLLMLPAGGSRMPSSRETVERNLHYATMNGREIFKFAVRTLGEAALELLAVAGFDQSDIDLLIPHQANVRIIEAAARRLNLPMEKVMVNVDRYGNTSTASIPLALHEALQEGRIKGGDLIVIVSFGTGLTWGALVIKWPDDKK